MRSWHGSEVEALTAQHAAAMAQARAEFDAKFLELEEKARAGIAASVEDGRRAASYSGVGEVQRFGLQNYYGGRKKVLMANIGKTLVPKGPRVLCQKIFSKKYFFKKFFLEAR